MLENLSKAKRTLIYISILSTSFAVMYTTIFQVINYNVYKAFPSQSMAVNFFISAPYLVIMIVSFISPAIYNRTNRKNALLFSCVIFTISALLFTHQNNIYGFITVNLICGMASAYINVAAVTMIAELYIDENTKAKYLGYYNSVMSLTGSLFSVAAGFLAQSSWIGAFNVYWSAAAMTLFVALFIPSLPKDLFAESTAQKNEKFKITQLGTRFWVLIIDFVALGITYFVPGFFLSLYIAEHGLGGITYTGIALSVDTLGGAIFAFFFCIVYKNFGSYSSVVAFVLMSAALFALYLFPNRFLLIIIVTLMGGSYMTSMCYAYQEASKVVPAKYLSTAMGIVVGVQYIATFFAAYITTGLMTLMQTTELTPILIFPAIWILIFAGIEYLSVKRHALSR